MEAAEIAFRKNWNIHEHKILHFHHIMWQNVKTYFVKNLGYNTQKKNAC